ncbi:hypothetical protein F4774DRAFT_398798 [Daldinia eschscholtzii]|nr:hypothetical protein F4774DRAFT_398798 [Daldinia eschscholtzii]
MSSPTSIATMPWCEPCGREFSNWSSIQQHWRESSFHLTEHQHCRLCDSWWPNSAEFARHLEDKIFHNPCFICNADFRENHAALATHMQQHGTCPIQGCGKVFHWNQLNDHLHHVHTYCQQCQKTFTTKGELMGHRETSNLHF